MFGIRKDQFIKCKLAPGTVEFNFPSPHVQTSPPEQLHDSGHHEWLNAGHHGACWQRHHRQGESSFLKEVNFPCLSGYLYLWAAQFSPVKVFVERKNRHKHCWSLLQQLLFCLPWNIYLSQVLLLERRVAELEKESETSVEQHARLRQENLQLVHRANALEEQLKEQELHADEQLQQESRRQKEAVIKLERERGLELENLQAR